MYEVIVALFLLHDVKQRNIESQTIEIECEIQSKWNEEI